MRWSLLNKFLYFFWIDAVSPVHLQSGCSKAWYWTCEWLKQFHELIMCIISDYFMIVIEYCRQMLCLAFYPPPKVEGYKFGVVRRLLVGPPVTNLLGLYLKDYHSFEHETSGVYRSHWGEVHCTRTITILFLIVESFLFVTFHTWILCPSVTNYSWGFISKTITDLNMKLQGCIDLIEEKCTAQPP